MAMKKTSLETFIHINNTVHSQKFQKEINYFKLVCEKGTKVGAGSRLRDKVWSKNKGRSPGPPVPWFCHYQSGRV